MAALNQYLMPDRNAEITLARSAAPGSISHGAKVLVLGPHGYETAIEGKNGFVCVVERGWMAPFDGDLAVNFWNPKIRAPICFNPPAARSILPMTYKRTEMVLAGQSKAQIIDGIKTFIKQELPPLEPGAMSYMMSKEQYLTDDGDHKFTAHLMFYTPVSYTHLDVYKRQVKGKNGFVCLVERGWMSPFNGELAVNFWNPKLRGPLCFNPPAARSILPMTYKRTKMVLAGQSKAQMIEGIKIFIKQELPPLEPGAMSYMMSKEQYLSDNGQHNWMAHLMFYTCLLYTSRCV